MSLADPSADVKGVSWARGGGFAIVPDWILDHEDLSDRAVRLFGILARYADKSGHDAFPSRRKLAERLRCAESTLDLSVAELKKVKAVTVVARTRSDGSPTSNEYVLNPRPPEERCTDQSGEVSQRVGNKELEPVTESHVERIPPTDATHPSGAVPTTRDILAWLIDETRNADVFIGGRVRGQFAKNIKQLLDEGATPPQVVEGLRAMVYARKVIPSLLGNFVMEAALPAQAPKPKSGALRYGRGMTAAQVLALSGRTSVLG